MSDRQLSPFVKIVRAMADQSPRRVRATIRCDVAVQRSAIGMLMIAATAVAPEQRGRWLR
jgi:hypothetical protein